jgi:CRP-like cAMP-binding protein
VNGDNAKTLAGIELFEDLAECDRHSLEAMCRWQRCKKGERILNYGSESREVFFVVRGAVKVVNASPAGREVAFATIGAGDCFGELSAIDGKPRSASVIAGEDTLLAIMPSSSFLALLQGRAPIAFRLLQRLTQMVRAGDLRIMELSTLAASHRVYAELLRMAEPDTAIPERWVVRSLPPLREIASRVSTTRETVARTLGQLYRSGIVTRSGRALYITDRNTLEAFAQSLQVQES